MISKIVPVVVLFLTLTSASPTGTGTPTEERNFKGYTECRSNSDCPQNYCCTVGMQRYSIPTCNPLGLKDDPCRPSQHAPENFTLSYPNLRTVEVTCAYLLLCPCDLNFACDRDSNTCQDPATIKAHPTPLDKTSKTNHI